MSSTPLMQFIEILSENRIPYAILRGYNNRGRLEHEKEIDVYIERHHRNSVLVTLRENKWKKSSVAVCRYPHEQFWGECNGIISKIDVLWAPVFGWEMVEFCYRDLEKNISYITDSSNSNFRVFQNRTAVILLILHILFDKASISRDNREFLSYLHEHDVASQDEYINNLYDNCYDECLEKLLSAQNSEEKKVEKEVYELVDKHGGIKRHKYMQFYHTISYIEKKALNHVRKIFRYRTYAFIGIDGAGKSTLIKEMRDCFGEISCHIYMGKKNFLLKVPKDVTEIARIKAVKKIILWFDFWARFIRAILNGKDVILFDRYPWDNYILSSGKKKYLNKILYRYLYPVPKRIFYLYCPFEVTLNRKDDIEIHMIERYKQYKRMLDDAFLNDKNIISIDTNENTQMGVKIMIMQIIFSDMQTV